ncbi:kinase-like protein [Schizophyllum commune H4-8]|uniref:kinase-like protein n=1 Tax=Schizophyllum commune (strain H4-8 / FGSC 9210) TaxID=578458 RepID=UPI00215EEC85|nr:kinase-like protein [Schizophyllum commune H4-8]KAI5890603.1 kinase-like protein [Schizophyllum commune H4-8]
MAARRPLPIPPSPPDLMAASPYYSPGPYPYPSTFFPQHHYDQETFGGPSQFKTTLPGGTLLHKGFYDLLAMIPTPSPSRFLLGATGGSPPPAPPSDRLVAGPRYETIRPGKPPMPPPAPAPRSPAYSPPPSPATPRKGRRISKDMVSNPTGFVHLVHASDADQYEALLRRWGPDGQGKLADPRWANPIKNRVRQTNQARAINEVVNALKPSVTLPTNDYGAIPGQLRVVNGISQTTAASSILTTAAHENVSVTGRVDGLPGTGRPGNSTIRWGAGLNGPPLQVHPEEQEHAEHDPLAAHAQALQDYARGNEATPRALPAPVEVTREVLQHPVEPVEQAPAADAVQNVPPPPRVITPSLATLEKAVACRIYFENLYFPLLRQPPSREQRRLAMERDMNEMGLSPAQKEDLRARWRQNETDYLRDKRRKVDVTAFVKLKTIGHGAFGVVSLVKERATGNLYAMKQLRKTDMLRKGQEGHVRAERDILRSASLVSSPGGAEWIVHLHYSFQDRDNLYLVLEYMGGGDLLNLLIERDVFEEDFTRFYIAEMILAIESCHKHGFIHRDIKPDNFLFDPNGHIKLSDFGLATDLHWAHDTSYYEQQRLHLLHKHGIDLEDSNGIADGTKTHRMKRRDVEQIMGGDGQGGVFTWREKNRRKLAYSVCGTNSYMSPEVIRGLGYTYSCDWWSLGVIMFECLYGFPPFVSNSRHITRKKILNWKQTLRFPSKPAVSKEGIQLMQALLCEPEDRLGSQASASVSRPDSMIVQARRSGFAAPATHSGPDGADIIKAHPWFRGIDWYNIHRYPAPYRPELRNPEDTRHFDPDIPPEPLAPANGAPADATKDPMLLDKVHGAEILSVRKKLAFAGFTHKSPRAVTYVRADRAFNPEPDSYGAEPLEETYMPEDDFTRGRSPYRQPSNVGRGRAISM